MIETTTNKMVYVVGSNPVFAFPVPFFKQSDVHCYLYHNGVETELILDADFSVEQKSDYSRGANVTLLGTLIAGAKLAIAREVELTQDVNLPEYGKLPTGALEAQLDKFIMICQQLKEITMRSFAVPHGMSDYDNDEIYNAFRQLVDNAETWANQAKTGATSAESSAAEANYSATSANNAAKSSADSASRALSAAGSASGAANNAVSVATEIQQIAEQATLNRVTLAFGEWGAEGILVSYNDWTNAETLTTVGERIAEHNTSGTSHNDIRNAMALLQNKVSNHIANYSGEMGNKISAHNTSGTSHNDIRANFNSTYIQRLSNSRCWISALITPVRGTRSTVAHNLNLSSAEIARAFVEVRLKCVVANSSNGYAVGDYAQWGVRNNDYYSPVQPLLTANNVSCVTGNGDTGICLVHKSNGSSIGCTLAQWAYEFRIWY